MGVSGPGSAGLWTGRRRSEAERNGAEVAPRPPSSRGGRRRKARGCAMGCAAPSSLSPDLGLAASNLHSPSTYVARCPGGVSCGTMAWQCSTVPFGPRGLFPAVVAGVGRGRCPSGDAVAMRGTEHASSRVPSVPRVLRAPRVPSVPRVPTTRNQHGQSHVSTGPESDPCARRNSVLQQPQPGGKRRAVRGQARL